MYDSLLEPLPVSFPVSFPDAEAAGVVSARVLGSDETFGCDLVADFRDAGFFSALDCDARAFADTVCCAPSGNATARNEVTTAS
jgi:hypothetical protein